MPQGHNGKTVFGARLEAQLLERNLSRRKFGRMLDAANPEVGRRNVHRWIDEGVKPNRDNRALVAQTLGVDPAHFADDDDEEADELARALYEVVRLIARRPEVSA